MDDPTKGASQGAAACVKQSLAVDARMPLQCWTVQLAQALVWSPTTAAQDRSYATDRQLTEMVGDTLAKPNYQYQKRQKELEKKKKQEEKRKKKADTKPDSPDGEAADGAAADVEVPPA